MNELDKPKGEEFCPVCQTAIGTCPECLRATVTVNEISERTRVRRQSIYAKSARRGFPVRKKKPEGTPAHQDYTDDEIALMERSVINGFTVSDARSILKFQDQDFTRHECREIIRLSESGYMLYEQGRGGGKAYRVWTPEEAQVLESDRRKSS